ncbi:hypothetical protein ABT023_09665 [Micromonospora sp. NPDC002296]|uniref:hypothetical protein n=1 Tax=Micromonospora sp. NPDC002296 TaxID=3154271 RepID=UPI0033189EBC
MLLPASPARPYPAYDWSSATTVAHSFRAVSGPVIRRGSGSVEAMIPSDDEYHLPAT